MLVMALVYYMLRPTKDAKFRVWWKRARFGLFLMLLGTVAAVVSLISASTWLFGWYTIRTGEYCDYNSSYQNAPGIAAIVISLLVCLFLML
jgi:hypothetical protein